MPRPIARGLAKWYERGVARRNARFDQGRGVVAFDRPVISVGNLSVGGTGKTPMVRHILQTLYAAGHDPALAMRGYGTAHSDPERPDQPWLSDEAWIFRRAFPDLALIAQPDRVEGLIELFATAAGAQVDSIVLDDGFQHRRIARDLDLVLLDASRSPWRDELLPAGWLREPVASLRRADAVVLTRVDRVSPADLKTLRTMVENLMERPVLAECRHHWDDLQVFGPDATSQTHRVDWLRGKRVLAVAALGNPDAFVAQVRDATGPSGAVETQILRDHDPYTPATIGRILSRVHGAGVAAIVTTEKDWTKLARIKPDARPCPIVVARLRLEFVTGGADLDALVLQAAQARPNLDPGAGPDPEPRVP